MLLIIVIQLCCPALEEIFKFYATNHQPPTTYQFTVFNSPA